MLEATFNWIGEGFNYGQKMKFFCISKEGVQLTYAVYKTTSVSDMLFKIERARKNTSTIKIDREIEEPIKAVFLVKTDDDFRKKFKRSYDILKLATESRVITIGAYTDNEKRMSTDNLYLICDIDFINLLADATKIESIEQIIGSPFEPLKVLFDKKELALELLKD